MISFMIVAAGVAVNAGLYAWHENPINLAAAVFAGLVAVHMALYDNSCGGCQR